MQEDETLKRSDDCAAELSNDNAEISERAEARELRKQVKKVVNIRSKHLAKGKTEVETLKDEKGRKGREIHF